MESTINPASLAIVQDSGARYGVQVTPARTLATGANLFKLDRPLSNASVRDMANAIVAADSSVEYAEPDFIVGPAPQGRSPIANAAQRAWRS